MAVSGLVVSSWFYLLLMLTTVVLGLKLWNSCVPVVKQVLTALRQLRRLRARPANIVVWKVILLM